MLLSIVEMSDTKSTLLFIRLHACFVILFDSRVTTRFFNKHRKAFRLSLIELSREKSLFEEFLSQWFSSEFRLERFAHDSSLLTRSMRNSERGVLRLNIFLLPHGFHFCGEYDAEFPSCASPHSLREKRSGREKRKRSRALFFRRYGAPPM